MTTGVFFGYLASVLVFATFYMKTIMPLRMVAISSNIAFITYALVEDLTPILILHALLLPLNILRLIELKREVRKAERAMTEDFSVDSILTVMKERLLAPGDVLFRKGDAADDLYYVESGRIDLPEIGKQLGPGDVLGEIGLFSTTGRRTSSAVALEKTLLHTLPRKKVASTLVQHPRLGIMLLRLAATRLTENLSQASPPSMTETPSEEADDSAMTDASRRHFKSRLRRAVAIAAVVLVIIAGGIAVAPTAYILLSRDSAVTSWINDATSPIQGHIMTPLPLPGAVVENSGWIVEIENEHADRGDILRSEARIREAETELDKLEAYDAYMEKLIGDWQSRTKTYAAAFAEKLDREAAGLKDEIAFLTERLRLANEAVKRAKTLSDQGFVSAAAEEEEKQTVLDLEEALAAKKRALSTHQLRRSWADEGIYIDEDGQNPNWAYQSDDVINLEHQKAQERVAVARAALEKAKQDHSAAIRSFRDVSSAVVTAPDGAIIWSRIAGEGAAVTAGAPIVSWIDCEELLVDVPSSDLLVGLVTQGMSADVIIEGETRTRKASVVLSRGAAGKLGPLDLAAVARGHDADTAQVVLSLDDAAGLEGCPVGRAASVDFTEISYLDMVWAFLRLQ